MSEKDTDPRKSGIIKEIFSYASKFIPNLLRFIPILLPLLLIVILFIGVFFVPIVYNKHFDLDVKNYFGSYFSAITLILTALGVIIAALAGIMVIAISLFTLFFVEQSKTIGEQSTTVRELSDKVEKQFTTVRELSERVIKLEKTKEISEEDKEKKTTGIDKP